MQDPAACPRRRGCRRQAATDRCLVADLVAVVVSAACLLGCDASPARPTSPTPEQTFPAIIAITGLRGTIVPGETVQLAAVEKPFTGGRVDRTSSAVWASSDPSVASVSPTGLLRATSPGVADVVATVGSLAGTATVRVAAGHGDLSGRIDAAVAADLIQYNQNAGMGGLDRQKGTITRLTLPIPLYVDASWNNIVRTPEARGFAERAMSYWRSVTGLSYTVVDHETEPGIVWMSAEIPDCRARTGLASTNLDNSARRMEVIIPSNCGWHLLDWQGGGDTYIHEFGHALGIYGHPAWGGIMEYGVGVRWQASAREIQFLVELYKLPHGAHIEPDGSWLVR